MQGVTLLGIYVLVAIVGQVIGFGVSSMIERTVPWAGMPAFLAIFFGMLVLAWPIAVAIMDRFAPETAKVPVRSL